MARKLSVADLDARGKRVLLRVDFNVPLKEGAVADDTRIRASLPTIRHLIDGGAKVIACSHLGRPKGGPDPKQSLRPVAARLAELLGRPVPFVEDCVGAPVAAAVAQMKDGDVIVLENLRFHPREEKNDQAFAEALAANADCYVNDAFGTAHRAHASTEGVTRFLKPAVAGFLIAKELEHLGGALDSPRRPAVAILGGAKISSKISVLQNLLRKVDALVVGGGMAFTFLKARGHSIGNSLFEPETLSVAESILAAAQAASVPVILPLDVVVTTAVKEGAETKVVPADAIPDGWAGVDIGPATCARVADEVSRAGTVIWNGPMGVFEIEAFAEGTRRVALALAESKAVTVLGGGETAAAAEKFGVADRMTHVSTGGGASLEFMEGRELPGISALNDAP